EAHAFRRGSIHSGLQTVLLILVPWLTSKWICRLGLPGPASEDNVAVECSRPAFATTAGFDPYIRRRPLDDVAQPDLRVHNKTRQAHPVRRVCALVWGVVAFARLGHEFHLLVFAVIRD